MPDHPDPHFGKALPNSDANAGLAGELSQLAGGDLAEIEVDTALLSSWNEAITASSRNSYQHRILLGLAIDRLRPEHGKVGEFHAAMGEALNRSDRWIRATVRVSGSIRTAFSEGVPLPLELCDLSWGAIPRAIDNIREGLPLDHKPEKPPIEGDPERQAAGVARALRKLMDALEVVEDADQRADLAAEAILELRAHTGDRRPDPPRGRGGRGHRPYRPRRRPKPTRRRGRVLS